MRLGITPQPYCTNSLGEPISATMGGLCDMASVSPVTLRCLLPYG
jgi:hypothetical protein